MSLQSPISLGNVPSLQYGLNKLLDIINEKPQNNIPNATKDESVIVPGNVKVYSKSQLNPSKDESVIVPGSVTNYKNSQIVSTPDSHNIIKKGEKVIKGEKTPILTPDEFLERISSFLFHIPCQWLYVVHFDKIPSSIYKLDYLHDEFGNSFLDDNGQNTLVKKIIDSVHNQRGCCWFAMDMGLPGEKISLANGDFMSNTQRGGLMGSPTLQSRDKFDELKLALLETNASFGDLVIRPWIKLASHAGMIARSADDPLNCKTDCCITFYSKNGANNHLVPRKKYHFHDVVPISINGETKVNSGDGDVKSESRTVNFTYSHYTITSELGVGGGGSSS
jgi:hypothetical protein